MNRNGVVFSYYIIPHELPNILSGVSMKYEVSNTKAFFYKFPDWEACNRTFLAIISRT